MLRVSASTLHTLMQFDKSALFPFFTVSQLCKCLCRGVKIMHTCVCDTLLYIASEWTVKQYNRLLLSVLLSGFMFQMLHFEYVGEND